MLNLIRRVEFPDHLQAAGPLIKASLLRHVSDYHSIVHQANLESQRIVNEAREEAKHIRESARQEALGELQKEVKSLASLFAAEALDYKQKATSVCLEICTALLENMMGECDEKAKMRLLIVALLERSHSARELTLQAHPEQVALVERTLVDVLGGQLNYRKCTVQSNEELGLFELNITTANGAQIIVSIENLMHMYQEEIDSLKPEIQRAFQGTGEVNEVAT